MNIFLEEINGIYNNSINYLDTDSIIVEKNFGVIKTQLVYLDIIYAKVTIINLQVVLTDCF